MCLVVMVTICSTTFHSVQNRNCNWKRITEKNLSSGCCVDVDVSCAVFTQRPTFLLNEVSSWSELWPLLLTLWELFLANHRQSCCPFSLPLFRLFHSCHTFFFSSPSFWTLCCSFTAPCHSLFIWNVKCKKPVERCFMYFLKCHLLIKT